MSANVNSSQIYRYVLEEVFSGRVAPGGKLVEQKLANKLGVSRIPVRETLVKLVGQGVLVGGKKGQGIRVREYTLQEVRDLYQYREAMEGAAAKAAATAASVDDLLVLEMICEQMDKVASETYSPSWSNLDHRFHETIANASRNERFIHGIKTLLSECHYVFFGPGAAKRPWLGFSQEQIKQNHNQAMEDHRQLLAALKQHDSAEAKRIASEHMSKSADRIMRSHIARDLERENEKVKEDGAT